MSQQAVALPSADGVANGTSAETDEDDAIGIFGWSEEEVDTPSEFMQYLYGICSFAEACFEDLLGLDTVKRRSRRMASRRAL